MFRLVFAGLALLAASVQAQIKPLKPGRQRAAERAALREAHRTDAPYKDSHLDVSRQPLRRGSSERVARVAHEPRFGRDGRPHVTETHFPGLHRRRSKNEPKP